MMTIISFDTTEQERKPGRVKEEKICRKAMKDEK
jgi:hypothetical protein